MLLDCYTNNKLENGKSFFSTFPKAKQSRLQCDERKRYITKDKTNKYYDSYYNNPKFWLDCMKMFDVPYNKNDCIFENEILDQSAKHLSNCYQSKMNMPMTKDLCRESYKTDIDKQYQCLFTLYGIKKDRLYCEQSNLNLT